MTGFATLPLREAPRVVAPDGSDVRVLLALDGGSMARFELPEGRTSTPIRHRTVEEIWYVAAGRGEMWRRLGERESIVALEPGVCLTVPVGTAFAFRSNGPGPLVAIAITMPPWPGDDEAVPTEGPLSWA